jgi:choline kinase
MAYTLSLANSVMKNNKTLVLYGDIAFSKNDLEALLKCKSDINILYDPNWKEYWSKRMDQPINDLETFKFDTLNFLTEIGKKVVNVEEIQGQYIGASFFTKEGWKIFYDVWTKLDSRNEISMTEVLNLILKEDKVKIYAQKLQDFWIEIDSIRDVAVAQKLISKID